MSYGNGVAVSKEVVVAQPKRAIAKSITYRIFGTAMSTLTAWVLSHDVRVSLGVCTVDGIGKIILYYVHERIWNHVTWGRHAEVVPEANV